MKFSNLLMAFFLVAISSYVVMANQDHDNLESTTEVKGGVPCILCRQVVSILYKELAKNATREKIEHLLAKSCKVIYREKEKQKHCEASVEKNAELILNSFVNKVPPEVVCLLAGMCLPGDELKQIEKNDHIENFLLSLKDGPLKVDWCDLCERSYPILAQIVLIDEFKENLRTIGKSFCNATILPINVKECNKKVDLGIEVLTTVSDPKVGCKKVSLCPNKMSLKSSNNVARVGNWWDEFKCSTCKMLVKGVYEELDEAIHNPSTKDFINKACNHIHEDDLQEKCKVDAYHALETLIKDFKDNLPPPNACEELKYCKKQFMGRSIDLEPFKRRSVCTACKLVYPAAHKLLSNKKILEVSLNITKKVCDRVPSKDKCTKAVTDLINNLANGKNSDEGCVTLCPKKLFEQTLSSSFGSSQCTVCQVSMVGLRKFFDSDVVKTKLNETLEQLCDTQDEKQAEKCRQVVRTNLPKFYERIHNLTDLKSNSNFCIQMGYCEKHLELTSLPVETENIFKTAEMLFDDERKFY